MRGLKVAGQLGAVVLVALLLGLLVWKVAAGEGAAANLGKTAPRFDLPALAGDGRVRSDGFRGRSVVVVNFWASWCGPCRDESPLLEQAWRRHRARGVVVVGIDTRDFVGDARSFVREFGLTYPNAYDGPGKLVDEWGLTGFPETFVLDREWRVVEHVVGPIEDAAQLDAAIAKARA